MKRYKGVGIGAGYFSPFQYEAWARIPEVEITALCNRNRGKADSLIDKYGISNHYTDYKEMIEKEKPDFIDIITPPETHFEMTKFAADRGIDVICQKPLAPTFEEGKKIVEYADKAGIRFMVHENWRFQPWHREIKKLIQEEVIGKIHFMNWRKRMGDGWGENAYIPRQPYFRDYPRLIVYENGIHFIDTFRYLGGEIKRVFAYLKKLNPVIAGEDFALVNFEFADSHLLGVWDASRYNEPNYKNPRLTFGEFQIDGSMGTIRLYADGKITIQELGKNEYEHNYKFEDINFAGDCVYNTQRHFIDCLINKNEFETNGFDYLKSLSVQEAIYDSANTGQPIIITK
ncbi:MAG: Gfo/Idh/MocA family oxidoreductase [Mariniphaga sp.]|nr:Gfo/Idh/MocA family oxidoreductase [Mariniphaga sp.]